MPTFTLEILFRIIGIGAASGLGLRGEGLYLISDNAAYLYEYLPKSGEMNMIPIVSSDVMADIPKSEKFDFEALAIRDNEVYVFGSGSTSKREKAAVVTNGKSSIIDLSGLYDAMRRKSGISADDFNIEGAAFHQGNWYLIQRGNGPLGHNGIFKIDGTLLGNTITYFEIPLPEYDGNRFGFTDMAIHEETIYFIAASENALSTYHDGEIAGSLFGSISLADMVIGHTFPISKTHKFEGIAYFGALDDRLEFLLCEDRDSATEAADIYRLSIKK